MLTVEAPGLLFPSLYDGAPKVIVIGCAMACGIAQSERLPVRVLRAILNDAGNLLRFEEPAAALGGGAPHRLLVPPTNVWCVFRGDDVVATGTAELIRRKR